MVAFDRVGRDGEVGRDSLVYIDDEVGAGALPGGGAGVVGEPVVELGVPAGELGEVVVVGSRRDLPEVVVSATKPLAAEGLMAEVTVTAKRAAPAVVELALVAGLPAGALVQ